MSLGEAQSVNKAAGKSHIHQGDQSDIGTPGTPRYNLTPCTVLQYFCKVSSLIPPRLLFAFVQSVLIIMLPFFQ